MLGWGGVGWGGINHLPKLCDVHVPKGGGEVLNIFPNCVTSLTIPIYLENNMPSSYLRLI